ncbi:MAG TPA: hypothetical protein VGL31_00515 [Xanthobacteraceae bacterium]|jgi:hypothetical protein
MSKIILSVVMILAVTSAASARCRAVPAGPQDYVDENDCARSIYSDWPNLQRAEVSGQNNQRRSHKHRSR